MNAPTVKMVASEGMARTTSSILDGAKVFWNRISQSLGVRWNEACAQFHYRYRMVTEDFSFSVDARPTVGVRDLVGLLLSDSSLGCLPLYEGRCDLLGGRIAGYVVRERGRAVLRTEQESRALSTNEWISFGEDRFLVKLIPIRDRNQKGSV